MNVNELVMVITADTSRFEAAAQRVHSRLLELRAEAEEIKRCLPGTKDEVDAVIAEIENIARVEDASGKA